MGKNGMGKFMINLIINGKVKEYCEDNGNITFEGEYLKRKKLAKEKNIYQALMEVYYFLKENI